MPIVSLGDVVNLYQRTFGNRPYFVGDESNNSNGLSPKYSILQNLPTQDGITGTPLDATDGFGVDIWLPIWLNSLPQNIGDNGKLFLPYATVSVKGSSSIIKTPLMEQRGSVKELYSIDDYKITIKGFFIDKQTRNYPVDQIADLKTIHELGTSFIIENALTDIFLSGINIGAEEQQRVVITGFDLLEKTGGKKSMQPFVMTLESDSVFTLEYSE